MLDTLPDIGGGRGAVEATPVVIVSPLSGLPDGVSQPAFEFRDSIYQAAMDGKAFSVGSGVVSVGTNESLKGRLSNPMDSQKRLIVTHRFFSNDRQGNDTMLRRGLFVNSSELTGAITVAPNKLNPDGDASVAEFNVLADGTTIGTPAVESLLQLGGGTEIVTVPRIVLPGQSFAYEIKGTGGALVSPAAVSMAFVWIEEDYAA